MRILRFIIRDYALRRILGGHRGHGRGRYGRAPRGGIFFPPRRHRRRSNVQVSGCCLPIPLGLLASLGIGLTHLARRRR